MVNGSNNISSKATEALVQHLVNSKAEKRMTPTSRLKLAGPEHYIPTPQRLILLLNHLNVASATTFFVPIYKKWPQCSLYMSHIIYSNTDLLPEICVQQDVTHSLHRLEKHSTHTITVSQSLRKTYAREIRKTIVKYKSMIRNLYIKSINSINILLSENNTIRKTHTVTQVTYI